MDGSAEDAGAPDSWEMADLEVSMARLMVSTEKNPPIPAPASDSLALDSVEDSLAASASTTAPSASAPSSEDVLNQIDEFLKEALQNPRERLSILRMEQDVLKFIHDPTRQQLEFQQLPTSYLRLAAHRVAQHYFLQSMVIPDNNSLDGSGSRIVVRKTSECRLPLIRLADIPIFAPQEVTNNIVKVAIKQRPQRRLQTTNSVNTHVSKANLSKSVEERKEEYNRARARIFSGSNVNSGGKVEGDELTAVDNFQHLASLTAGRVEEKCVVEGPEVNLRKVSSDSSTSSSSSRTSRSRTEKELATRFKANNRVAIFRDRELDRKDPDYDRSYERYVQRFDPGFGFNGGPYSVQPIYSPALNYNTEFPQLASGHRQQITIEHQPRPMTQHMRGPWTTASSPTAIPNTINYGPPDSMMAPFNPNHVGAHSTSAIYLHSQQYACPRPGMAFVHHHEHVHQPFAQTQQQPEATFGLARPR